MHAGYGCVVVGNGREALEKLSHDNYDMVLMDCQMPEMDGYEATRALRELQGTDKHTPVVAMTASVMKGDRERCFAAGMDDYLAKPITRAELHAMLQRWLESAAGPQTAPEANVADNNSSPVADAAPVQLDYLREYAEGDAKFVNTLIRAFLKENDIHLKNLITAIENANPEQIAFQAHALKNGALTLKADRLTNLALQLEEMANKRQISEANTFIEALRETYTRVAVFLQTYLEENPQDGDA